MKDREPDQVTVEVVESTDRNTLEDFVAVKTEVDAVVYTDDHKSYAQLPRPHGTVKHSVKEFVDGQVHTNGMESFWSTLKRGHMGVYHKMAHSISGVTSWSSKAGTTRVTSSTSVRWRW